MSKKKKVLDLIKLHSNSGVSYNPQPNFRIDNIINKNNEIINKLNNNLSDREGLNKAYNTDNKIFVDGNKMYIAGTSNVRDVYDDLKIPFHLTKYSQRYQDAEETLKNNPQVDSLISHSLGGSVALEMNNNYNDKFKTTTYSAPVFDLFKNDTVDANHQRYRTRGDIVSAFDTNAITHNKFSVNPLDLHSYNNYGDNGMQQGVIPE